MSLKGFVHQAVAAHHESHHPTQSNNVEPKKTGDSGDDGSRQDVQERRQSHSPTAHFQSPPNTPSMRTGPPRSLSFAYSLPGSPPKSRENNKHENGDAMAPDNNTSEFPFSIPSDFRSALEWGNDQTDKKGKKRESRLIDESWNPIKWFQESPKEEKADFHFNHNDKEGKPDTSATSEAAEVPKSPTIPSTHPKSSSADDGPTAPRSALRRAFSGSNLPSDGKPGRAKWGRLRSLIPNIIHQDRDGTTPGPSAVTSNKVNITDELIAGGLSTLMLRLWFERDEKDHRRIPVLFHRLRIRISDSLHPMQGSKAVFRIECEYANGAARWVVYRQLRDFFSLHTHYTVSNVYRRNVDNMPEFPRTSLPYFKFLKKEGRDVGHADFARLQRESLENYLIELIRAVMFHPSANRLAGFLEISALSIALAPTGGAQYKAGFLKIEVSGLGGGFSRKSASWKAKKEVRWCAIRESYLVAMEEPGELTVWDVFLLDSDFRIERPKRYYRQGLSLLHAEGINTSNLHPNKGEVVHEHPQHVESDCRSMIGSITDRVGKLFHIEGRPATVNGKAGHESPSSSSSNSIASQPPPAMLDPSTNVNPIVEGDHDEPAAASGRDRAQDVSKHTFYIVNAQMRLKLIAHNERQMLQWITALEKVAATSHYAGSNRFDSFAPIRLNVAAQWLVDGRDYFWNLSRAILLARESIYIHDWWLSPELQMRRPDKDRYRLDRLLERKAKEGVKIYIILYQEVSNRTTPTDSNYAKQRLVSLHPNVMVQRSPSHFQTGTFYWAHHEKMCVIDQAIAFMGGLDLCFGRWDTAQHVLTDDTEGVEQPEIWPGKDYSNPRLSDFYNLHKPEEDMYDRSKIPRMPWHDVAMQVVGQPARDLARHFVQRWNYLLRIKNHTRVMPFLLPPPEFKPGELHQMGLTGTCELQICRSTGPWSMGTPGKIEFSIQNAYLKAIQMSEHFVYIENQFFITSTVVNDVKIENKIGDALVHRIIRAHRDGAPWKCCIMIPLLPGFTFPVDHSDASAIRIILECQNRTISRGPNSIFARLRKEGIDPDEYITVFSLRNWAKMRGDVLTTEQVYIHGKVCIVDDRLAIIGSANINERSQRGDRDSELAAVIRDTDMLDCTMAGKPFKVGRFAHTLRVRLMREHLGVDVDALDEENLMANEPVQPEFVDSTWDPDTQQVYGKEEGVTHIKKSKQRTPVGTLFHDAMDGVNQAIYASGESASKSVAKTLGAVGLAKQSGTQSAGGESEEAVRQTYTRDGQEVPGFTSAIVPTLEEKTVAEHRPTVAQISRSPQAHDQVIEEESERESQDSGPRTDDGTLFGAPADASKSAKTDDEPPHARSGVNDADEEEQAAPGARASIRKSVNTKTWTLPTPRPKVDPHGFDDPIADAFWKDVWVASAAHNTEIYRKVFHPIPDDLITTWKQYKDFIVHHERLNKKPRDSSVPEAVARIPSEAGDEAAPADEKGEIGDVGSEEETRLESKEPADDAAASTPNVSSGQSEKEPKAKKYAKGAEPFEKWERDEMEKLLGELNGHLVLFPNRFLEGEDIANNFVFNADRLLPLPIYT
ncbi:phospholipase D [Lyophyllum atratum]|nr:phospholipase D [Lyophyllum atratum]